MILSAPVQAFAEEAVVRDERRGHAGTAGIRAWIEEASIGLAAIAARQAEVFGNFAESSITLTFASAKGGERFAGLAWPQKDAAAAWPHASTLHRTADG